MNIGHLHFHIKTYLFWKYIFLVWMKIIIYFLQGNIRKYCAYMGLPGGSDSKESASNGWDLGLIPGPGRSLGEGNGNPLQYSCLENSMDRGAWRAAARGVTESNMTDQHFHFLSSLKHRYEREEKNKWHFLRSQDMRRPWPRSCFIWWQT